MAGWPCIGTAWPAPGIACWSTHRARRSLSGKWQTLSHRETNGDPNRSPGRGSAPWAKRWVGMQAREEQEALACAGGGGNVENSLQEQGGTESKCCGNGQLRNRCSGQSGCGYTRFHLSPLLH